MPFSIIRGDITHTGAEAVVNAANKSLAAGSGVCGAIFSAAGHADLQAACDRIGHCDTGEAAVTPGFALSRWIIHAVGPVWRGGRNNEEYLLRSAYRSALEKAEALGAGTVAFPLISAGVYGYPPDEALAAAVSEIGAFLTHSDLDVTLVIYDRASFRLPAHLRGALQAFLESPAATGAALPSLRKNAVHGPAFSADAAAVPPRTKRSLRPRREKDAGMLSWAVRPEAAREDAGEAMAQEALLPEEEADAVSADAVFSAAASLEVLLKNPGESFSRMLLRLIDESGRTDADVYRHANLDRRLFSKIRSNADYQPSKATVLALAVSLRLDLDRTLDLLRSAGFTLSPASRRDRIVEYFLRTENWNIFELNEALFEYDEPALGA